MERKQLNYGKFVKEDKIPRDWTHTDYLIHNNTLKLSSRSYYDLNPIESTKHINLRCVLYAMLELHHKGNKYFGFLDVEKVIRENKYQYGKLIKDKARHLTKSKCMYKNMSEDECEVEINKVLTKLSSNLKFRKDNIYYWLDLMIGRFSEIRRSGVKKYRLNVEGHKLYTKIYRENYVL